MINEEVKKELESAVAEVDLTTPLILKTPSLRKTRAYSEQLATKVVDLISQGMTMSRISQIEGMPSVRQILTWKRHYPEFGKAMKLALECRAQVLADAALEVADKSTWQTAKSDTLKIETAKWLASSYDRETFGAKTQISGDPNAPLTFLISTGITRESDDGKPLEVKLDNTDYAKETEKKQIPDLSQESGG